jgi:hypothetical protein
MPGEAMAEEQSQMQASNDLLLLSLFVGMGVLSCLELILVIPSYFKQWRGMYFWGVTIATAGASMMVSGNLLLFVFIPDRLKGLSITLIQLGYALYCPADYVMLYSRLHLVGASRKLLRWVAIAIIVELIFVEIPGEILYTWTMIPASAQLQQAVDLMNLTQGPFYYVLQNVISGIYVHHIYFTWKDDVAGLPRAVKHMFLGFTFIVVMDLLCLALQEAGQVDLQACVTVRRDPLFSS